jgi:hypothetical protein
MSRACEKVIGLALCAQANPTANATFAVVIDFYSLIPD